MNAYVPLVEVHRGSRLESLHVGAYVLLRGAEVIASGGDLDRITFYRSASKPLQALVAITSGAVDRFGWSPKMLAIASGSHSGTSEHVEVVRALLARAEISATALACGAHWPFDRRTRDAVRAERDRPLVIESNCSGKHAAMLGVAKTLGAPLDGYLSPEHPVQQAIREQVGLCAGVPTGDVEVMIDGCGAPTFAVPLRAAAVSMQQLGQPEGLPAPLAQAVLRIRDAMLAHPEMIGGPGRFDTVLMQGSARPLIAKAGAEGIHATVMPDDRAVLFVKTASGQDRGYQRFVLALLARHGYLTGSEAKAIAAETCPAEIKNHAGDVVGHIEAILPG